MDVSYLLPLRSDLTAIGVIPRYSEGSRSCNACFTPRSLGVPRDDNELLLVQFSQLVLQFHELILRLLDEVWRRLRDVRWVRHSTGHGADALDQLLAPLGLALLIGAFVNQPLDEDLAARRRRAGGFCGGGEVGRHLAERADCQQLDDLAVRLDRAGRVGGRGNG